MCYGTVINGEICPYETKFGRNVGDCNKPYDRPCPYTLEYLEEEEEEENGK